jgi:hypothetical protein
MLIVMKSQYNVREGKSEHQAIRLSCLHEKPLLRRCERARECGKTKFFRTFA